MLIDVNAPSSSYKVRVGEGIDEIGLRLREESIAQRILVITDENVASLYKDRIHAALLKGEFDILNYQIPSGEEYKNLSTANEIYSFMSSSRLERFTPVLGFGGGVVGDIAAFCASTYLRGIPFYNAPTTLLSQVDSSVGGKTGVNLSSGKNLVGTFYQPGYVHADVELLKTLTKREYISGLAEVVKHALIQGEEFLSYLEENLDLIMERDPSVLEVVVSECVRIKARVVENDEKEEGLRRILNLGHTLGHALEKSAGYGRITHGEGVSTGIVFASLIAQKRGESIIRDRVRTLLSSMGLPVAIEKNLEPAELITVMGLDKKVRSGKIEFVIPYSPGRVLPGISVSPHEINEALMEMYE